MLTVGEEGLSGAPGVPDGDHAVISHSLEGVQLFRVEVHGPSYSWRGWDAVGVSTFQSILDLCC